MTTADDIAQILAMLRTLALQTDGVAEHLEAIDAKLADMPSSAEVSELRGIVTSLQADMQKIKNFVGDTPLHDRLLALERDVASYKVETAEREAEAADVAGTAKDPEHREMAREEAGPLVDASEQRSGKELRTLAEVVGVMGRRVEKLVDVSLENRWLTVAGVLFSAAIIYVLVQVVPW